MKLIFTDDQVFIYSESEADISMMVCVTFDCPH